MDTPDADRQIYDRAFWIAYAANLALVVANSMTFRFAELVSYLGGTEKIAGTIVSLGIIMALAARLVLGQAIDRYGAGRLWILTSVLFITGCVMFAFSRQLSWPLYLARVVFAVGLSGMFTCSVVHIQNRVPAHRRTEVIGSLGSSGFLGMILGTNLSDWILNTFPQGRVAFSILFGTATVLGLLYFAAVFLITRQDVHVRPHETPAAHRLILRYWPGTVMLVAIMMGIGFAVTTVFLTRFATHLKLRGIGAFFTAYAISAFIFRISGVRWSRTLGRHRVILLGLAGHLVGFCLLPLVTQEWHFILPACCSGFGHALLFPAVVSLGAGAFPVHYRGTGTTIVLGFTEIGHMTSAPILGWIIETWGFPPMFLSAAVATVLTAGTYAVTSARKTDEETEPSFARGHGSIVADDVAAAPGANEPDEPTDEPVALPFPQVGRSA